VYSSNSKTLSVCTLKLAGNMVIDAEKGFLIDVLNNTLGKYRPLKVQLFPPVRAFHSFAKKDCDVLVSASERFITKYTSEETVELPIGLRDYHTVFSHSDQALKRLDLAKPQNFVSLHKWFIPQDFAKKHHVYFAHSLENALKMLKAKRVDYFIGFNFLSLEYIKEKEIKGLVSLKDIRLDPRKVVFLIHKRKNSNHLKTAFKKNLLKYVESGDYDRDINKHNVPNYVLMSRKDFLESLQEI
tara:strand:- start:82 stop:807 length:726 start_codon:yes stop_codon:yes gene_type:complete